MAMPYYSSETKTLGDKQKARHAKGKFILIMGIIMLTLFFGLLLCLMTVSLSTA
jgi:hypothetical protein